VRDPDGHAAEQVDAALVWAQDFIAAAEAFLSQSSASSSG
jgi:hypothetical protein